MLPTQVADVRLYYSQTLGSVKQTTDQFQIIIGAVKQTTARNQLIMNYKFPLVFITKSNKENIQTLGQRNIEIQ